MKTPLKVVILEDCPEDAELLVAELRRAGFAPDWQRVATEPEFLAGIKNLPDLILSDYSLPGFSGLRAVELLREAELNIPFILISGTVGEDAAVEAMRRGATDYLLKDRLARLGKAIETALEQQHLRAERRKAQESLNLFRKLIDQSNDAIDVVDPETGRFLDVNDTACRRLGYSRDELLNMTVPDIEATFTRPTDWREASNSIRQAGARIFDGVQRRKDGSTFPVEINVRAVKLNREYLIATVRDITERRKADQELRESQALYQSLVGQMPAGIFRKDRAGRYVFVNPWFCELRGLAAEQILGKTAAELADAEIAAHGQTRPEIVELLRLGSTHHDEILRTGKPVQAEEVFPAPGGGKRFLQVVKSPVFGLDGQISGTQGVQLDITELKRVEASLTLFRTLINRSSEGIDVIDPETGRFLDVNEATCLRSGYTREELLGMKVSDLASVPLGAAWRRRAEEIRQAGSQTFEALVKRKNGFIFPVEISIRHVQLDRDYLISSVRDITERKKAEDVLRASEGRYRKLFEHAPDGILITDPNGRCLDANPNICEMLGYEREELLKLAPTGLLAPEEAPNLRPALNLINAGADYQREWQFRRKDGTILTADIIVTKMPDGNLLAMVRDISDRKRAQEEIQSQLNELQRWHEAMLGREDRVLQLKTEINQLLAERQLPPRYPEATHL